MGSGCTASRAQSASQAVERSIVPKAESRTVRPEPTPPPMPEEPPKEVTPVPEPEPPLEPVQPSDIWKSIEDNDIGKLKRILTQTELGPSDLFNLKGQSILHVAAAAGNTQAISTILDSNIPTIAPDMLNSNLATPLHSAVLHDKPEVVKTLIAYGADANIEDEHGQTPILLCSIHGRIKILETFIEANNSGKLSEPLNVNARDRKGLCALNCSAIKGEIDMCKLLLEKAKANVDEPSHKGCTALLYSARGGYDQIVELLIEHKANKNHQDASGATALHHGCEKNFPEVVAKLIKGGADPNVQDLVGRTPVFETIINNSVKSLEVLLDSATDLNAIDSLGHTALFYAARDNNQVLVEMLVEKGGADVNLYSLPNQNMEKEALGKAEDKKQDRKGQLLVLAQGNARAPIHAAAAGGHAKMVEYLISKGAKAIEPARHNNSTLHLCAYLGNMETARALIKAGVDLIGKNTKGLTPLDLFQKYHPELMKELMEATKMIPEQKIKVYEGEIAVEDEELSMRLDAPAEAVEDPRIGLIGAVFGEKVAAALMKADKRYKGLRWILKNYSSAGLTTDGVKALLAAVALGLEERIHKMNVSALDLLDSLIINAIPLLTNDILEGLGIIDLMFVKAMSTTDRFLNRILDTLPKIGDLPGVGIDYLINKSMSHLKALAIEPDTEEPQGAKRQKSLNVLLLIMLKLIDSFGPDNWPFKEIEDLIAPEINTHNKSLKANIQQMMTILKDSNNEIMPDPKIRSKEDMSPSKKAAGVEEHILTLQESMNSLYENSEDMEWEDKYKQLLEVLAEKNIMNFMGGVDICSIFLSKALQFNRKLIETHLIELMQPILNKIDSTNKRVKTKCRELVLIFWKTSIETKDWLHTHMATYLTAPEQHKLFVGAISLFQDILDYLNEKKITESKILEESLGVDLEKVIRMASNELGNKVQQVRKLSLEILTRISGIVAVQTDRSTRKKLVAALENGLRPLKPAVKDKVFLKLNKDIVEDIKRVNEEKASPEKGAAEDDKLIYAEPLASDLKAQLVDVLQYFSEDVTQCLYSQNWASRSAALNKIKEELVYTTLGETGGSGSETQQRNVNISGVSLHKATEAWVVVLKHILEDPVLKIYIDGLDLLKEVVILFKKYIPSKEDFVNSTETLLLGVIGKLGDQKPKIREKSIDLLLNLVKEELIRPERLSAKITEQFEQSKGGMSANQLSSILKIGIECVSQYKVTEGNQKELSAYMQLLNSSLKHPSPGVRQLAEELYSVLFKIHGDGLSQYLVNQKGAVIKKLQALTKRDTVKTAMSKTGTGFGTTTGKAVTSGIATLRNLLESGSDSLLNSEDPAQRIKGLMGIKKYITKQQAIKEISADKAHEILEELSMLMRTVLNDTNPDVYTEALKLLKFALNQLLKHLTPFDLQITVNTIISILIPKTIASPNHKIQIASDKFILSLGKESLVGPIIIIKNLFRLLEKLASESTAYQKSLRTSGSQHGFAKHVSGAFDLNQNIAAVMRYLGVANLVLSHYKTVIAHSKEAIECFVDMAVKVFTAYADKCQIKEAVAQISRDIRAIDWKAFESLLSKKEGEVKAKLTEILSATVGEFEEKQLEAKEGIKRKMGSSKGFPGDTRETAESATNILPVVRHLSSRGEEQKAPKNLPSYSKRVSKMAESNSNFKQVLPPLMTQDKAPHALPPLVMKKGQVNEPKREIGKPNWLEGEKPFFRTKEYFADSSASKKGGREEEGDDIIMRKAAMSQPFRFPK